MRNQVLYQAITIGFKGRFTPLGTETDFGNFTFADMTVIPMLDLAARQSIYESNRFDLTQDFQVGKIRVDGKPRGRR